MEELIKKLEEALELRERMADEEAELLEKNAELDLYELGEFQDMNSSEIEYLRKQLNKLGVNSSTHPHLFMD